MTQPIPHAVSFILDGTRHEVDFLATPAEATALFSKLETVRLADLLAGRDTVQDWQVRPLSKEEPGSAAHLLETITEEVFMDDADELAKVAALKTLAEANDALAGIGPTGAGHVVDFAWDNGGGDDNCFTQSYQVASGEAGERASEAFADALEDWLVSEGHGYDFSIGPVQTARSEQSMAEAIQDLAGEMEDHDEPSSLASTWAKQLRETVAETAPAPSRRKPSVR